ncbi:hypothetical protein H6G76_03660 [Nostoc sp. FACHB-152]|uniref:hypothetical protein n=1 Tax=unclassified Nostoc TaxID=2593658 RepID=UPI0016834BB4|nr:MULTISPECIES: hypothetical protein [unclassified Nostoc]MBD2446269.1 hypothetical protein [Nostoc sp. FACHB-152]MBD2469539.1 hypothetical protein [Nostoc sp. FACHB-145]
MNIAVGLAGAIAPTIYKSSLCLNIYGKAQHQNWIKTKSIQTLQNLSVRYGLPTFFAIACCLPTPIC